MKIYQKIQKLNLPLAIPLLLASLLFVISSCSSAPVVDVVTPSTGVTLVTPCPANIDMMTPPAGNMVAVTWTEPTAQDSNLNDIPASGITITDADGNAVAEGGLFTLGDTTVTYTFTDDASPSNTKTCTFTVTVSQPSSTGVTLVTPCPTGATGVTAVAETTVAVSWTAPTATDSNGATIAAASIVSSPASGSTFTLGDTVVTTTVTDTAGNEKTCSFTVTVTAAALTQAGITITDCPDNIVQTDLVVTWTAPTAKDSNDVPIAVGSIVSSPTSGSTFTLGDTVVTTTVTDTASNVDTTCTFTVTIYYFDRVDDNADPSQANPFLIKTSEDLANLSTVVNDETTYPLSGTDTFYSAAGYRLETSLDLGTGYTHIPIGACGEDTDFDPNICGDSDDIAFTGTFDGNGETLTGLTYSGSHIALGLFSVIDGATISDLTLADPSMTNTSTDTNNHRTGALVGYSGYNSTLSDVHVIGGTITGFADVGGIVGVNYGTITASSTTVTVIGDSGIGGIVGNLSGGSITASYATGAVSGASWIGGLVGFQTGSNTITASYATGLVTGTTDTGGGGLVGFRLSFSASGATTDSYWDTETTDQTSSDGGVGYTTAELQILKDTTNIYKDWDDTVWTFSTTAYPTLK